MNELIKLIIVLIVAGALSYIVGILTFLDPTIKRVIQVIIVVAVIIYAIVTLAHYLG